MATTQKEEKIKQKVENNTSFTSQKAYKVT